MLERYKYSDENKKKIIDSMVILVDTRERKNDHIISIFDKYGFPYECRKLDYGDYSFYLPKNPDLGIFEDMYFDQDIMIERKQNLEELSKNFTQGRRQFENELLQAPFQKVIMVETNNYSNIVHHDYETMYNEKLFLDSVHRFWIRYNCPVAFVNPRDSAVFIRYHLEGFLKEYLR